MDKPTPHALGAVAAKALRANGSPHGHALADWIEAVSTQWDPAMHKEFTAPKLAKTVPVVVKK
jgi:hypothetical protein